MDLSAHTWRSSLLSNKENLVQKSGGAEPLPKLSLDLSLTRPAVLVNSPISSAADAPEFIHGEERRPPNVEIKKRLLHTGPFPVGSSHRPKTLPREPRFPTAVRTRREALQSTAWSAMAKLGACPGISIQVTSMDDQSVQVASIRPQCLFAPIPAA